MQRTVPIDVRPEPGQLLAVTAAEYKLAVANVDGTYFAFQDTCTHEECSLSEGELDEHVVICYCHGGEFDVRTGEPIDGPVYLPLRTFRIVQLGDEIHVDLGED